MPAIALVRVCLSFTGQVQIFDDASVRFEPGWTGVVGANGAGKTSLLRLLCGSLDPDSGVVRRSPEHLRVVWCRQDVATCDAAIREFAGAGDRDRQRLRAQLDLDPATLARWPTLSPGERRRWQVGTALAEAADVLLLDEPTNHVDDSVRAWLLAALARFTGIGVVVAHDRAFLDALTNATVRLAGGQIDRKPGPYSAAQVQWQRERQAQERERSDRQAQVRNLQETLQLQRMTRASVENQRSVRQRSRGRTDADARSIGAQTRVDWAEARQARKVAVTRRALVRAEQAVPTLAPEVGVGRSLFAQWQRPAQVVLAALSVSELRVEDRLLLRDVHVQWRREDRVVVVGSNGTGKSTLLRQLIARSVLGPERLLILPQELSATEVHADLQTLRQLDREARGRVLQVVAALGVAPERLLASASPSPGEARKLRLALGLGRSAAALVLDEPTNHLDLPAIEHLEAALVGFPGAILVVTHDAALAARVADQTWRLAGGRLEVASA